MPIDLGPDGKSKITLPSPTIGSLAPKFSGPNVEGDIIDFENINSKVIMIDFWASWCAPCRVENPHLVSLNSKYKNDEFQIVGISLDRDKESWVNAINEDNLSNWVHISHVKFWNEPIAKLYNITRMPTTFILNSEKRIIAMDNEIYKEVEEKIKNDKPTIETLNTSNNQNINPFIQNNNIPQNEETTPIENLPTTEPDMKEELKNFLKSTTSTA